MTNISPCRILVKKKIDKNTLSKLYYMHKYLFPACFTTDVLFFSGDFLYNNLVEKQGKRRGLPLCIKN
jgi:hypothetical protein